MNDVTRNVHTHTNGWTYTRTETHRTHRKRDIYLQRWRWENKETEKRIKNILLHTVGVSYGNSIDIGFLHLLLASMGLRLNICRPAMVVSGFSLFAVGVPYFFESDYKFTGIHTSGTMRHKKPCLLPYSRLFFRICLCFLFTLLNIV